MNEQLENFARTNLKSGLEKLPESHQLFFKRIYSHKNQDNDINDIVDMMSADELDRAMQQVERSLAKMAK